MADVIDGTANPLPTITSGTAHALCLMLPSLNTPSARILRLLDSTTPLHHSRCIAHLNRLFFSRTTQRKFSEVGVCARACMGEYGQAWASMGRHGRARASMGEHGQTWGHRRLRS